MSWGKSIVLAFVLFAAFIGTLVVVCLRQDIPLVAQNYYEQELRFQEHLDQVRNTNALVDKPVIHVVNDTLEIRYSLLDEISNGELELFRPSDARLDHRFMLNTSGQIHRIPVEGLPGGLYKARLRWKQEGREYFLEDTIYL